MSDRLVIGLCGPEGAGKSTVARMLVKMFDAEIVPFALPLKRMLLSLGVEERHVFGSPADKEEPLEILGGKSARWACQSLGTEWGRDLICHDLWVKAWHQAVDKSSSWLIIADDLRFQNEATAIKARRGVTVCVLKEQLSLVEDAAENNLHRSQQYHSLPRDFVLVNDSSLDDLKTGVWQLMEHLHATPKITQTA